MKNDKRVLKHIVESLLREASAAEEEDGVDSIDAQVDKLLSSYEAEAQNAKNEGLDFRMMTRRFLLEADEEDKDEKKKDKDKGEEKKKKESLKLEDINVTSFTTDVMRMVDNYDTLLEMRNTLLRRATNYLVKNYDKATVEAFKAELLEAYGIEIGESKFDRERELEFQPPPAAAAGPAGGAA